MVNEARIDMLKDGVNYNTNLLRHNKSLISVDATPDYLFFPHSPEWILCVCPWIKLVIILRDPISRCYSNYMYNFRLVKEEKKKPTFEKFLSTDLSQLRASGFFNATSADGRFHSYRKYLANRQGEGPVARSLYEFQLRQWIDAFRSIEREPTDAMHIVTTEQMEADPEKVLNGVYKFLGLPPAQHKFTHAVKSKYTDPIQPKTRDKLEDIFLPANQRLYRYLINEGFGDGWKNYWEKKGTQEKKE